MTKEFNIGVKEKSDCGDSEENGRRRMRCNRYKIFFNTGWERRKRAVIGSSRLQETSVRKEVFIF